MAPAGRTKASANSRLTTTGAPATRDTLHSMTRSLLNLGTIFPPHMARHGANCQHVLGSTLCHGIFLHHHSTREGGKARSSLHRDFPLLARCSKRDGAWSEISSSVPCFYASLEGITTFFPSLLGLPTSATRNRRTGICRLPLPTRTMLPNWNVRSPPAFFTYTCATGPRKVAGWVVRVRSSRQAGNMFSLSVRIHAQKAIYSRRFYTKGGPGGLRLTAGRRPDVSFCKLVEGCSAQTLFVLAAYRAQRLDR